MKNFMEKIIVKIIILTSALFLFSCSAEVRDKLTPIPNTMGKVNEIVVVADKSIWEGPVGDTIQYYLSSAYLILPQPEPIFDLRFMTPDDLLKVPIRKNFRSYLFVGNLSNNTSETSNLIKQDLGTEKVNRAKKDKNFNISIGRNKWAAPQLLIYQFAYSEDDLITDIKKNYQTIAQKVHEHDESFVEANIYQVGINKELVKKVKDEFNFGINIPGDYFLALHDSLTNTLWLRKETDFLSSNIFIHKRKYTDQKQLSKEGIKEIRNTLGKYVTTDSENTFMYVNDVDLPMFVKTMQIDNHYAVESRGIWEIANDYMGGPFISYIILNRETNELLYLDGFIHAPGKEKRNYMQQLEMIFTSVKL
jgi:Domain of unknown function (DUF4837)